MSNTKDSELMTFSGHLNVFRKMFARILCVIIVLAIIVKMLMEFFDSIKVFLEL